MTTEREAHRYVINDIDVSVRVVLTLAEHQERSEHFGCPCSEAVCEVVKVEADWSTDVELTEQEEQEVVGEIIRLLSDEYGDAEIII